MASWPQRDEALLKLAAIRPDLTVMQLEPWAEQIARGVSVASVLSMILPKPEKQS